MPMDKEDERYFTQQFNLVHKRITDAEKSQTGELHKVTDDQNKKITEIRAAIDAHKLESNAFHNAAGVAASEAARKAIEAHEEKSRIHNPMKALLFLVAFISLVTGVWGLIVFFVRIILPAISK